jgi:hypothetical protein
MMSAHRSTRSRCAILILFVLIAIPTTSRCATLEESAKELARKIAASLPAKENVTVEIRNTSSLDSDEVLRIDASLKTELQERGIRMAISEASSSVDVTLSENLRNFVWTAEIQHGDHSQVLLLAVERHSENRATSGAMPVTIHSEKFWEGPERILDAGEISNGAGKSWLVLLLPNGLRIEELQSGAQSMIEVTSNQSVSRDPWGNLGYAKIGDKIGFMLSQRLCTVDLQTRNLESCLPTDGSSAEPSGSRYPVMIDVAPPGTPPPGKGTEIKIVSVCGGASQFLATGAGDYTQTDSLQVFETKSSGAIAISDELDVPGPITALHSVSETPRAIVRNLSNGNYEAYRFSFSCAQ